MTLDQSKVFICISSKQHTHILHPWSQPQCNFVEIVLCTIIVRILLQFYSSEKDIYLSSYAHNQPLLTTKYDMEKPMNNIDKNNTLNTLDIWSNFLICLRCFWYVRSFLVCNVRFKYALHTTHECILLYVLQIYGLLTANGNQSCLTNWNHISCINAQYLGARIWFQVDCIPSATGTCAYTK